MKIIQWCAIVMIALMVSIIPSSLLGAAEDPHEADGGCSDEHGHGAHEGENSVSVAAKSQTLIDLKTVTAKLEHYTNKVSVVGQVAQDPESTSHVMAPIAGVIAECRVNTGSVVSKDETVCIIKNGEQSVEVKAPIAGVVISEYLKPGDKVDTISSLHTIADLSKVWVTFDVYEKDIACVQLGQAVEVRSIAYPKKTFSGEITFISPCVERDTNAMRVRALVQNPGYLLKLGMFITADILIESSEEYIVLPLDAVHSSGDKRIVFIKTGDEKFDSREVCVEDQSGDRALISSGIKEGEVVAAENSFLLKSELLKSQMGDGCAE